MNEADNEPVYVVKHMYNNKLNKVPFLEKSRATEYAARWHGTVHEYWEADSFVEVVNEPKT